MTLGHRTATRREREREERRQGILEAAANVFKSKGFAAATMDDVAAAAELSKGTLYLYFKNKDDLYLALSAVKLAQIAEAFRAIAASGGSGLDQLRRMLIAYGEAALEDEAMFRIAIFWVNSCEPVDMATEAGCQHRDRIQELIGFWVAAIERGVADGSIRSDIPPLEATCQIWAGMIGALLVRINADELSRRVGTQVDFDRQIPGFVKLVCDGLIPRA